MYDSWQHWLSFLLYSFLFCTLSFCSLWENTAFSLSFSFIFDGIDNYFICSTLYIYAPGPTLWSIMYRRMECFIKLQQRSSRRQHRRCVRPPPAAAQRFRRMSNNGSRTRLHLRARKFLQRHRTIFRFIYKELTSRLVNTPSCSESRREILRAPKSLLHRCWDIAALREATH